MPALHRRVIRALVRTQPGGTALAIANQPYWIAHAYGGTDKTAHGYLPFYARYLGPLRLRRNVILEIGIGEYESRTPGGSLHVWRDYFPRSLVVGLDLHPKDVDLGPRVRAYQGDQSSPDDLARVVRDIGGTLDVVIDDGSHVGEHQWVSFQHLFPRVRSGGWYVIEDLSTSYWPEYGGSWPLAGRTGVGLLAELTSDVQLTDPVYDYAPQWGRRPGVLLSPDVAEVHVHPGIAFVKKR